MNRIKSLRTTDNWEIIFTLENGEVRKFSVKSYLDDEAFQELKKLSEFKNIRNGGYYIEWESGADLSLDPLYAKSILLQEEPRIAS